MRKSGWQALVTDGAIETAAAMLDVRYDPQYMHELCVATATRILGAERGISGCFWFSEAPKVAQGRGVSDPKGTFRDRAMAIERPVRVEFRGGGLHGWQGEDTNRFLAWITGDPEGLLRDPLIDYAAKLACVARETAGSRATFFDSGGREQLQKWNGSLDPDRGVDHIRDILCYGYRDPISNNYIATVLHRLKDGVTRDYCKRDVDAMRLYGRMLAKELARHRCSYAAVKPTLLCDAGLTKMEIQRYRVFAKAVLEGESHIAAMKLVQEQSTASSQRSKRASRGSVYNTLSNVAGKLGALNPEELRKIILDGFAPKD
jgi:hypothetical protein